MNRLLLIALLVGSNALAQQLVNVGSAPNDGTGDPARTAFQKLNANNIAAWSYLQPLLTGDVTGGAGSNAVTIALNAVGNGKLAQMPAQTIKCNLQPQAANASDCSVSQVLSLLNVTPGGGTTGGLTNFTFTAPAPFTVTGASPFNTDGATFSLGWASGLTGNQVLATPCGSNGTVALRSLCGADLPVIGGDIQIVAGVSTIPANQITNDKLATMPPQTIKCNTSGSNGIVTDCTAAQVAIITGSGGGGGGSSATNIVDLCTQPGVDATGANDSQAGVKAAFALVAGTNSVLSVNCPIRIVIGYNPAKPIFVHNGTNLNFGPSGVFMIDNVLVPAFVWINSSNSTWNNPRFEYVGQEVMDPTVAPYTSVGGVFNDTYAKGELASQGYTFSNGGSNLYQGLIDGSATIRIQGASNHLNFINAKFFVPDGTPANKFMPVAVSPDADWKCCNISTNSNPYNATYAQIGSDINFINPVLDGVYMGFVSSTGGRLNIVNAVSYRYSDLQDASGGTQGGVNNWFAPPHFLYLQNGDGSFNSYDHVAGAYDYGIYVGGATRRSTGSGTLLSYKLELTNNATYSNITSLRPDGCYEILNNAGFNQNGTLNGSTCVFNSATVANNGGTIWGMRFPSNGNYINTVMNDVTIIDNAPSPTSFPIIGNGYPTNQGVSFNNLKVYQNDWNNFAPGFQFGGTDINVQAEYHYNQTTGNGTYFGPIQEQGATYCIQCNFDVKLYGWRQLPITFSSPLAQGATTGQLSKAWPYVTGTYQINFPDSEVRYATIANGASSTGTFSALSLPTVQGYINGTTLTVTSASAAANVVEAGYGLSCTGCAAGTVVTSLGTGTGNQQNTVGGTGVYQVTPSQTVGSSGSTVTITPNPNVAYAANSLVNNFNAYKPRISLSTSASGGQISSNSRAHILDVSNSYEITVTNGIADETWTQSWSGTPLPGATTTLPLIFPNTMSTARSSVKVTSALSTANGLTNFGVGWAGNTTALFAGVGTAVNSNPTVPVVAPIVFPNNPTTILLTAGAGSFGSTGSVVVSVQGEQISSN